MRKGYVAIGALVLLVGVIFWGIGESKEKEVAFLCLEGEYQRSFFALADEIEEIDAQLAKVLVTADRNQLLFGLSNLWRSVYGAVGALAKMPAMVQELEYVEGFLRDIAGYSYYLLEKRVVEEEGMQEGDWDKLQEFYRRAELVGQEISALEAKVLNGSIRFSELMVKKDGENLVGDAFFGLEDRLKGFPKVELEDGVRKTEPIVRDFVGEKISQDEAVEIAEGFFSIIYGEKGVGRIAFVSNEAPIGLYTVEMVCEGREDVYIEISQKGGHVLQLYGYQNYPNRNYTLEEGISLAEAVIDKIGLKNMVMTDCEDYGDSVDVTFVVREDGVYIYGDMVKVLISLDNATVMGYDQSGYISNHYERDLPKARYSVQEIREVMNPNFEVGEVRLALLRDEYLPKEYLTYELRGKMNDEMFAIFVDAQDKRERKIVRLTPKREYEFIFAEGE